MLVDLLDELNERPFFHEADTGLYGEKTPLLWPDRAVTSEHWAEAKRRWEEETLPAAIAAGTIIDRGPDFLAKGFATRLAYA